MQIFELILKIFLIIFNKILKCRFVLKGTNNLSALKVFRQRWLIKEIIKKIAEKVMSDGSDIFI